MNDDAPAARLRFNCYLLRAGLTDVEMALRAKYRPSGSSALKKIVRTAVAPVGAVAYLGHPSERVPRWAEALDAAFPGVGVVTNRSNRLVIFLPVRDRWFAVCFGYGSGVLEWDAVESNFGLKLAARRLRPDDVTELRSRRIDASARTQSVQVPVGADLRELGVELEGEFVRKLSGHLESEGIGDVAGSVIAGDSIAFKAGTDLSALQSTLGQMLEVVEESSARDEFQFVDSLEPLRRGETMSRELDKRLAAEILKENVAASSLNAHILEFAPPDEVQMDEVDRITVTHRGKSTILSEFTLGSLREALHDVGVRRGVGFLKDARLVATNAEGEERSQLLPLRSWLVFEVGDLVARYVLTLGRWFRLQETYSAKLNADLGRIKDVTDALSLPDARESEHEGPYNARAASGSDDLVLLDKVLIGTEDGTAVEACDLFRRTGHMIHVKRYNGSQTLSHLFSQGSVSAELLNGDPTMRTNFLAAVTSRDETFRAPAEAAPQVVTYAIAVGSSYNLPVDLPTFSKVNLRDFARRLQRMRVLPTIAHIKVV